MLKFHAVRHVQHRSRWHFPCRSTTMFVRLSVTHLFELLASPEYSCYSQGITSEHMLRSPVHRRIRIHGKSIARSSLTISVRFAQEKYRQFSATEMSSHRGQEDAAFRSYLPPLPPIEAMAQQTTYTVHCHPHSPRGIVSSAFRRTTRNHIDTRAPMRAMPPVRRTLVDIIPIFY